MDVDAFLSTTRQGVLLTVADDGSADGVPVWFDWDGTHVRFFCSAGSPKTRRMAKDPRVSMLVMNNLDEAPEGVRFEGRVELAEQESAKELALDVLAPRYWDVTDPDIAEYLEGWRQSPDDAMVVYRFAPDRIRTS